MRWTEDQLNEYRAKLKKPGPMADETPDDGLESKLQSKCMKYCKDCGYPVFHDRSRKKNEPGWPDLFIFMENKVKLVELKSACGKLRKEQEALRRNLMWLGHTVHVCKSYAGFIRIMEETKKWGNNEERQKEHPTVKHRAN